MGRWIRSVNFWVVGVVVRVGGLVLGMMSRWDLAILGERKLVGMVWMDEGCGIRGFGGQISGRGAQWDRLQGRGSGNTTRDGLLVNSISSPLHFPTTLPTTIQRTHLPPSKSLKKDHPPLSITNAISSSSSSPPPCFHTKPSSLCPPYRFMTIPCLTLAHF